MITSADVIRRIEMYFAGGLVDYLSPTQLKAAKRAVSTKPTNPYDDELLTLHNARLAACNPNPDHSFAEPVTLSSADPTDFPLPGTAARICFDLLASRARRRRESREEGKRMQEGPGEFFPQFANATRRTGSAFSQIATVLWHRPAKRRRAAHSTTMPAPPRRGSPAAESMPSRETSTAAAPPK